MQILFFAFVSIFLLHFIHSKEFIVSSYRKGRSSYEIEVLFDSIFVLHRFIPIDLTYDYSLLSIPNYQPISEVFLKETTLPDQQLNVMESKGFFNLVFSKTALFDFYLYINTKDKKSVKEFIGLAFHFNNENYSLMHQLKKNNRINELSFTFERYDRDKVNNELYIGGYPKEKIINQHKASLNVNDKFNSWGVNLYEINIEDHQRVISSYDNSHFAIINTNDDMIYVTKDVFSYIKRNVFSRYINENICEYIEEDNSLYINCLLTELYDFPNITIVIDGVHFTLPKRKLFVPINSEDPYSTCIIQSKSFDYFILGTSFFDEYITQFNYEQKQITFYSEIPFVIVDMNNVRSRKINYNIILITEIMLLMSTFTLLLLRHGNDNKRANMKCILYSY